MSHVIKKGRSVGPSTTIVEAKRVEEYQRKMVDVRINYVHQTYLMFRGITEQDVKKILPDMEMPKL